MNYQKLYDKLMETRKTRYLIKEKGYEIHHIIPRCLGGTDEKDNLVPLTPREHFVAHKLLVKIHPTSISLNLALFMFIHTRKYKINSRTYEKLKNEHSQNMKKNNPMFVESNVKKKVKNTPNFVKFFETEKGKEFARQRMRSDNHPMKNKKSVEKKLETQRKNGNYISWTQTKKGKEYFSKKFKSDEHPLKRNPQNCRTAFPVEVTLPNGEKINFPTLKSFYEHFNINKDVAAKMIRTNSIPKKHLVKFIKLTKMEKSDAKKEI
jgi:hypothetical protein